METEVVKVKNSYTVKFTIGVQTFTLADYGVRTKKEAEWLEERLKEAFADFASQFKLLPVPSVTITDEEIEKQFPTDVKTLSWSLKYPSTFVVLRLIEENRMAQQGAKWAISQLQGKETIK
jgi:hypothetical protein